MDSDLELKQALIKAFDDLWSDLVREADRRAMGFQVIEFTDTRMTKTGKVEIGKTPSVVSGKPSKRIVKGEPLADQEKETASMKKLARAVGKLD